LRKEEALHPPPVATIDALVEIGDSPAVGAKAGRLVPLAPHTLTPRGR
jgi:hypothetical protein